MDFNPLRNFSRRNWLKLAALHSVPAWARAAELPGPADAGPGVMLAKRWRSSLNPADYWVSEKLDGVRAVWTGAALQFRSGRPIAAPAWFVEALPRVPLDGELWLGRQTFERLSGTVRRQVPVQAEWLQLRYMVFDAPRLGEPFGSRLQHLQDVVAAARQPWLQAVAQSRVINAAALQVRLDAVSAAGGEGLVLHRSHALWAPGRSNDVLKLKVVPDEEGVVLAQVPGTGKYQGRMGALLLEAPGGKRFFLGTGFSDAERAQPPPIGALVTYRYRQRTAGGLPKFASFVRVRAAE